MFLSRGDRDLGVAFQTHPGRQAFLSRETGMSGHFVGRIKGDKYRFELQFLKWDFS